MPAFDVVHAFDGADDAVFFLSRGKVSVVVLPCLLEEKNPFLVHEEVQKFLLLFIEKRAQLILQLSHLPDLLVVVFNCMVGSCPVDDDAHSVLDVIESLEASVKVLD
jgi:predicted glycosyltransferase